MNFTITQKELIDPLRKLLGVVPTSEVINALGHFLIEPATEGIRVTATNSQIRCVVEIPVEGSNFEVCTVPAQKLMNICQKYPAGAKIEFSLSDDKKTVEFKHKSSRYSLQTVDAETFPSMESADAAQELELPEAVLMSLIDRVHYAAAKNDVRYFLVGVLLEVNADSIVAVATDGHRMAWAEHRMKTGTDKTVSSILPSQSVAIFMNSLTANQEGTVTLQMSGNHLGVVLPATGSQLDTLLVEGKYVDYSAALPADRDLTAQVNRADLSLATERLMPITEGSFGAINLSFNKKGLQLTAENKVGDKGEEQLETKFDGEVSVSLNAAYLVAALDRLGSDMVAFGLKDSTSSLLITDPDDSTAKHVIMPLRL